MSHWTDRLAMAISPRWGLLRQRARLAATLLASYYDAAATTRRTSGWRRLSGDATAAAASGLERTRAHVRHLARNNPYIASALRTITDHTVGWGIVAKPAKGTPASLKRQAADLWAAWADTTACDADGQRDFAGLQKLVVRTVARDGEVLVRRRWRRPADLAEFGLPLPLQLQVLEPDFLDTSREGVTAGGSRIVQGVEFNPFGRRIAYWLFRQHPGANLVGASGFGMVDRIPASEILHIYDPDRAGAVRGVSWFAPVVLRVSDLDDYEDAALMKQKIAACLAVITSDVDGSAPALGATDAQKPEQDLLEPGMILNAPPGRSVTVVEPPSINEHEAFTKTILRSIATGIGVTFEDLTGSYENMPFSAARMSRLREWAHVEDWRWRIVIPQFCNPAWRWAMEAAAVVPGFAGIVDVAAEWTAPPAPMIDPATEGRALQQLVRIGALSWPGMLRERGEDPEAMLAEIAEWNRKLDAAGVVLDCDPRHRSQQGQPTPPEPDDGEPAPARAPALSNGHARPAAR
jgi:lambda family phage portal protein